MDHRYGKWLDFCQLLLLNVYYHFKGLKGEQIPLGGRILAICDVFDAISSQRHYRDKMPIEKVIEIINNGKNLYLYI